MSRPLAATILAAGLGRRLGGCPKAALPWQGLSLLERQVQTLRVAGLQQLQVVIGPYADVLQPLAEGCGVMVVRHELAEPSLVDSQRLALRAHRCLRPGHDLLLLLADLPWLTPADLQPLISAWAARPHAIQALRPVVNGVSGHPLLLSRLAVRQIHFSPPGHGVRHWLTAHPERLALLPSHVSAYLQDVDTPQDLATLQAACPPPLPSLYKPSQVPSASMAGSSKRSKPV